jgi:enediyne biosynthesis protein E4
MAALMQPSSFAIRWRVLLYMQFVLLLPACSRASQNHASNIPVPQFVDVAPQAGLTVSHLASKEQHYIVESMGGGVGFFDCDNDGRLDIVVTNGSTVDRYRAGGDLMVTLYHQGSDGKFSNITEQAGLAVKGWGMGVAVADYDNDGILDLFVTGYGHSVLYRGLGNCKFENVTEKAGLSGITGFATGAAWGDYDRDGYVDLFVSRYVHVDMNHLPAFGSDEKFCRFKGVLVQCGPWGMPGESDYLFRNRGDGTFEDVSKKAGVDDPHHRFGLGAIWADYDNDGWPDLFVANDAGPNFLYHNRHDGTFEEVGMLGGVALGQDGQELGSMGVDFADYDHAGRLDLFVTNYTDQVNNLYRNLGEGAFSDMSWPAKLGQPSYPYVKWGTGFVDFDNDGWVDIFVNNGHVYPQVDAIPGSPGYKEPMQIFRNHHDGTFEDISKASGVFGMPPESRRGAAFGDVYNDGNMDILVLNIGEPPSLLINKTRNSNHRVAFHLMGTKSNRAGIGARVTLHAGAIMQFNEVRAGGSYLSQNDLRLHFGLGTADKMDTVEVSWPSGEQEVLRNVLADFMYTITEGQGITARVPLPPPVAPAPSASEATVRGTAARP